MSENNNYSTQKKHLAENKKQLRVWVDTEKYAKFQEVVKKNETSIYSLINNYIDEYIKNNS